VNKYETRCVLLEWRLTQAGELKNNCVYKENKKPDAGDSRVARKRKPFFQKS